MEGTSSLIREKLNSGEDQICPECGHLFRSSRSQAEAEELCEICHAAQLEPPHHVARWQTPPKRAGRAVR